MTIHPTPKNLRPLTRYSKKRGPGDQTSGGRGKLLQSDLSHTELLVRETIQNSWDAKLEDWTPAYGLKVRRTDASLRRALRNLVFEERAGLERLEASLRSDDLHVTEVYDRGTRGLDGPVRSGQAPKPGEPNNFNALVFDIGTSKARIGSGGTYGFGKTAAFEASACHTVIYWTRTFNEAGRIDYRLIACCLGDPYETAGQRFTGAHWWGAANGTSLIEPLQGEAAMVLGEELFETHFGDADDETPETGTSMLIIDPVAQLSDPHDHAREALRAVRSDADAVECADQLSQAISRNLWPKLLPRRASWDPPMIVSVFCDAWAEGEKERTPSPGAYSRFGYSLQRVRAAQDQADEPEKPVECLQEMIYPIKLSLFAARKKGFTDEQILGSRRDGIAGHLHLWSVLDLSDEDEKRSEANSICIMRSAAELVVGYIESDPLDDSSTQWHGVFKPTPECDRHFAACEPPSHDTWSLLSTAPAESAHVVGNVLRQIRSKRREFLHQRQSNRPEESGSVWRVSSLLRSFAPLGDGPEESSTAAASAPRNLRKRVGAPPRKSYVEITGQEPPLHLFDGTVVHRVRIRLDAQAPTPTLITPVIRAVTFDGGMELEDTELHSEFEGGDPILRPGESRSLQIYTSAETRLDLRLEEAPA